MDDKLLSERIAGAESALRISLSAGIFILPLAISLRTHDGFGIPKLLFLSMLAVACCGAATYLVFVSKRVNAPRGALPFFVFPLIFLVSVLAAPIGEQALWGAYRRMDGLVTLLLMLMIVAAMLQLSDRDKTISTLRSTLTASAAFLSIYGLSQYLGYDPLPTAGLPFEASRSSATLGNPDHLAAYLAVLLPVTLSYFLEDRRLWALVVFILQSAAIATTGTRAGMIAAAAALTLLLTLRKGTFAARTAVLALFLITFAAVSILSVSTGRPASDPTARLGALADTSSGSFSERLEILKTIPPAVVEQPLIGSGPGSFRFVFERHMTTGFVKSTQGDLISDNAHNLYAQYAVELGIFGLLAFLWMFTWLSLALIRRQAAKLSPFILAALGAFALNMLFGILSLDLQFLFWLLVGLALILVSTSPSDNTEAIASQSVHLETAPLFAAVAFFALTTMLSLVLYLSSRTLFEADASYERSQSLLEASRYEEAEIYARDAAALFPTYDLYTRAPITVLLEQAKDPTQDLDRESAQKTLDKLAAFVPQLMQEEPRDLDNFALTAQIQLAAAERRSDMDLVRTASRTLDEGLLINENWLHGLVLKGTAEYLLGDYDDASKNVQKALALVPENRDAKELEKLLLRSLKVREKQR